MLKDTLERTRDLTFNLNGYLENAYVHPVFKDEDDEEDEKYDEKLDKAVLVATKRQSRGNTPAPSKFSSTSSPSPSPSLPNAAAEN